MERLTAIVAVNHEGVIGAGNSLPWRVKSDMDFFKDRTKNNLVIMGRLTFDSLGRKCLPKRRNLILTHSLSLLSHRSVNCRTVNSIDEALFTAESRPKAFKEVFIIGGASVYKQFAPYIDRYLITVIHKNIPNGDAFFDDSIIADDLWQSELIKSGKADGEKDEADFDIFELKAKDADSRASARNTAIQRYQDKIEKIPKHKSDNFKAELSAAQNLAFHF